VLRAFLGNVFGDIDALVLPTIPDPIPTRAETDVDVRGQDAVKRFLSPATNTRAFNYLGLPALSAPCGLDGHGLPVGMQVVGRPFAEARLLRIVDAFQRDSDWHRLVPREP
jgi:aspartyl-tRNA(Asn)/glutamyl-tRNA(Gln) amidotransferase subunit A